MSFTMLSRKSEGASATKTKAVSKGTSNSIRMGEPNDAFELEADRVADEVVNRKMAAPGWLHFPTNDVARLQRKCACNGSAECEECAEEKKLQRKSSSTTPAASVPSIVHEVLALAGKPLDAPDRRFFERCLGYDLSKVRIHTDGHAAESARAVNALAYTVGQQVVFSAGKYDTSSDAGRKLLAHELVHTVQQSRVDTIPAGKMRMGKSESPFEEEADHAAERVAKGGLASLVQTTSPLLQRVPSVGWQGSATGSRNAAETTLGNIRRIPIMGLTQGNQDEDLINPRKPDPLRDKDRSNELAKGRAIVLLRKNFTFAEDKPVEILLHFHGWNSGNRSNATGQNPDEDIYRIEQQLDSSNRPQLIAILPQGNSRSWFGETGGKKVFDSDSYIREVLDSIAALEKWNSRPKIGNVMISGHSGAGEIINEKLLGGAAGSSLPSAMGTLKEVALFDAINGPHEFLALENWLDASLKKDLAALNALSNDPDRLTYLASSMRFRLYFHIHKEKDPKKNDFYYSQWNIGPLPKDPQLSGKRCLEDFLDDQFKTSASAFSKPVSDAWRENYKVINLGDVAHDAVVNSTNTPSGSSALKEAIDVFPKREQTASGGEAAEAPELVNQALRSPARPLDPAVMNWAREHFGHDFNGVRVHTEGKASESARAVRSLAYTVGNHVVFGAGRYDPKTAGGRRLLAHELVHVLQQANSFDLPVPAARLRMSSIHGPLEREADLRAETPGPIAVSSPNGELVLSRAPAEGQLAKDVCETTKNPPKEQKGECNYARPENCPTYESWIETFSKLKTFKARANPTPDTKGANVFDVLGGKEASRLSEKPNEKAMSRDPDSPPFPLTGLHLGETFIDHPTDTWVKNCLPENLRITAYQLPADCADIAIILRHVWLSAHHRTQVIRWGKESWTIGDAKGGPATGKALKAIGDIGSSNVQSLVAPYSNPAGDILITFAELEPLLHPGDILVWEHRDKKTLKTRSGGHTQTITDIKRDNNGKIEHLSLLQGNQPIFGERCDPKETDPKKKAECEAADDKGQILKKLNLSDTDERRKEMGDSPGRRIEVDEMAPPFVSQEDPKRNQSAWFIDENTFLVAAGPPRAASRPATAKPAKGAKAERRLSDWVGSFKNAHSVADWQSVWESALLEARAFVEGGRDVPITEAQQVGDAAGNALWGLAKKSESRPNLGDESHFVPLMEAKRSLESVGSSRGLPKSPHMDSPQDLLTEKLMKTLRWIDEAFDLAARGASDIKFGKADKSVVKVLLTGFDPFEPGGSLEVPAKGQWNPSGAAVLALDNGSVPAKSSKGNEGIARVQGIILPVSYDQFKAGAGLVESIVQNKASDLDAAITVSMAGIAPGDPVRLERYVIGTHATTPPGSGQRDKLEPVAAAGLAKTDDLIIESNAPLDQIAADTEKKSKIKGKASEIPKPTLGEEITFRFADATKAKAATTKLGGAYSAPNDVTISDEGMLHQITRTMVKDPNGTDIAFKVGGVTYEAAVAKGPGGDFLSNEVSYRMLRLLKQQNLANSPISFHVHTQEANPITQVPSGKGVTETNKAVADAKTDLKAAGSLLSKLVETLKRLIAATAKVILDRRATKK